MSGADLPAMSVTTSETNYCLEVTPCQEYVITVTPFSTFLDYMGPSKSTTESRIELSCLEVLGIGHG